MRGSIIVLLALSAVVAVNSAPPKSGEEDVGITSIDPELHPDMAAVPQPQKRQIYNGLYNPYGHMGMGYHMMGMGYSRMGMGVFGRKRREASPNRGGYGGYGGYGRGGHGGYGGGRHWGRKRRDLSDVSEYNQETDATEEEDQSEFERSKRQMMMGLMNGYNMGMMPYYNNYYF